MDPHRSNKSDLDPHQSKKPDTDRWTQICITLMRSRIRRLCEKSDPDRQIRNTEGKYVSNVSLSPFFKKEQNSDQCRSKKWKAQNRIYTIYYLLENLRVSIPDCVAHRPLSARPWRWWGPGGRSAPGSGSSPGWACHLPVSRPSLSATDC